MVQRIEAEDQRSAWIFAASVRDWYGPTWGVYRWSLADGQVTAVAEGEGEALGFAARARRVFIGGHSWEIRWQDLDSGASGALACDDKFAGCSPDGRFVVTQRPGSMRRIWCRLRDVAGDAEPSPEVPAPLVFSDDGRFAAYVGPGGDTLEWIVAADRSIVSMPIEPLAGGAAGILAVRGAPRVIVWHGAKLLVCDLAARRVVARHAVDALYRVTDATADRCVLTCMHGAVRVEALDFASGARVRLPDALPPAALTPDGRRALCQRGRTLAVVDAVGGAVLSAREGHEETIGALVWSCDGRTVATVAGDGRVRLLRTAEPRAVVELAGTREQTPKVAFSPDGQRVYVVTAAEIAVADVATGAITARFASFGQFIHSAEVTGDGRSLVIGSYMHGIRVVDLATGRHVVHERDATLRAGGLALVGDHVVTFERERVAGGGRDPVEHVRWVRLTLKGKVMSRGTWSFAEVGGGSIELRADGVAAMVTWYPHAGYVLRTFDLRAPDGPGLTASIPRGAKLFDSRRGRALFHEGGELVRRDPATGAEVWRIGCPRRVVGASLSHDGAAVAVAYRDAGVEVFAVSE